MISAAAEENDIESFYRNVENRRLFFKVEDTHFAKGDVRAWVPQMPALPAELALEVVKRDTTPWELKTRLETYGNEKSEQVQELLMPLVAWAVAASTKTGEAEKSSRSLHLPTPSMPSRKLKTDMKSRLDATLGKRPTKPEGQPPIFQRRSPQPMQAAQAAVASVAGQQHTVDAIGDFYQKGVTDAMRIYQENATDDPYKKRFTDVQKGLVMGWCGVTL